MVEPAAAPGVAAGAGVSAAAAEIAERSAHWTDQGADRLAVLLSADGFAATTGGVFLRDWSEADRRRRAARWWAGLWALGLAFVFVPILHFVVPPALLVAGPLVASRVGAVRRTVFGGIGPCPRCGAAVVVGGGIALDWPVREACGRCYLALEIAPAGRVSV